MDQKGILFILLLQRLSQLADWKGGGPPGFVIPMERRWGCKKRRERGCGVEERLRDYWTLVYFVDIAAVPFFIVS